MMTKRRRDTRGTLAGHRGTLNKLLLKTKDLTAGHFAGHPRGTLRGTPRDTSEKRAQVYFNSTIYRRDTWRDTPGHSAGHRGGPFKGPLCPACLSRAKGGS